MKRRLWKSIVAMLVCTSVIGAAPAAYFPKDMEVYAAGDYADENGFVIEDGVLKEYTGTAEKVVIPEGVTSIAGSAFSGCNLTDLIIPEGVISIATFAFFNCTALENISFPSSLTKIAKLSLSDTKWMKDRLKENPFVIVNGILIKVGECGTKAEVPDSVTSIGEEAFVWNKSLLQVSIPDGVESIEEGAFYGCDLLTSVIIPDSVKSIVNNAFGGCKRLTIYGKEGSYAQSFAKEHDIPFSSGDVPEAPEVVTISFETNGGSVMQAMKLLKGEVPGIIKVPERQDYIFEGWYTDSICETAFDDTVPVEADITLYAKWREAKDWVKDWEYTDDWDNVTITKYMGSDEVVTVPAKLNGKTVSKIGAGTFNGNKTLKEIIVQEGISEIDMRAIRTCEALRQITLPRSLSLISWMGEMTCVSLQEINVQKGNSNYSSKDGLLCDATGTELIKCPSGRESVTVPKGITKIQNSAFGGLMANNILNEVILPEGVTSIGSSAFWNCENLGKAVLPDSISSIGREAFAGCRSLKEIVLPAELRNIEYRLFSGCVSLEKAVLPAGLETIEREAFSYCSSLNEITIPASVTDIEKPVFDFCSNLKVINVEQGSDSYQSADGVLYDADGKKLVRCPEGKTSVAIMDSVTAIESYAFSLCTGLSEIVLPAHLRIIEARAFLDCESLHKITIPAGVADIGYHALGYIDPKSYGEEEYKVKDFVITGYADTAAELYAKENEMSFQSLGNRPDVLSAEKMLQLAEENATQETLIETPNGVTFTFEKDSMNLIDGKTSYDFGSKISEDYSNLVNPSFAEDEFAFQIDYNYEGQLPGEAKISIPVESKWIGKRLYYYEIDADGGYKYMGRATVAKNGMYTIKQDHCSSYIAVAKAPENLGNADGTGEITTDDALAILKYTAGLDPEGLNLALADCDGTDGITTDDALAVLKYIAGIQKEFY